MSQLQNSRFYEKDMCKIENTQSYFLDIFYKYHPFSIPTILDNNIRNICYMTYSAYPYMYRYLSLTLTYFQCLLSRNFCFSENYY